MLNHVGRAGYREICAGLRDARDKVIGGIGAIDGLRVLTAPEMCLVAFVSDDPDVEIFHLADLMIRRGWYVQPQLGMTNSPRNVHLTITPANVPHMDRFLVDLAEAMDEARRVETPEIPPMLAMAIETIDFSKLDDATFDQLLQAAGLGAGGDLPEDRVIINLLLDRLDAAARERILVTFFNGLYVQ